jgi:hypothetical protein
VLEEWFFMIRVGIFPQLDDFIQQIHARGRGFKPPPPRTARADVKAAKIPALRGPA